ncbi:caspase family protein [Halorarum salinum]|uniref:Caspase family protein n=1 Tax=Halorarum salinum TaxID=2743089 RepID=A0A7D5LBN4_9EURY|nr:caspase family protein [Halobaculum salinum]QLG62892.1 caspase family protein [Halobaculum salinum]
MIRFERDGEDLLVRDDIEDVSFRVDAGGAGRRATDADGFVFPVDSAVTVETDHLAFRKPVAVYVREDGSPVDSCPPGQCTAIDAGRYELEVSSAPMKLYLRLDGPFRIDSEGDRTRFEYDGTRTVRVGARSFHGRPAGTVTVPETPRGLMDAVSTFGSALATTSPERSFPTLRGHPPLVSFGDEREIPSFAAPPGTGVRIAVPEEWGAVYTVATLAYYLGATVVPGDAPAVTAAGTTHRLDGGGLAAETREFLEHVFLLDCVVRTEGFYDVDLHERRVVDERVDLDLGRLYDLPLDERLAAYVDVPTDDLSGLLDWHLTADVAPEPSSAELLPFVVNDLSAIRNPEAIPAAAERQEDSLGDFYRSEDEGGVGVDGDAFEDETVVTPEPVDTVGHVWVGDGYPVGASKPTVGSYRRRLDQPASESRVIDVQVVCNEDEMREETEQLYGFRDYLEFDIDIAFDLTCEQLRELLAAEHDFLHFVGHVDAEGMKCSDGYLDLHTLEGTGVKAFLLNACTSYTQGMELVRAGSIGGLVTTTDVGNIMATNAGRTMARLLDYGFDLHGVLDVVKKVHVVGGAYSVVGDAGVTLCQADSGAPTLVEIMTRNKPSEDRFEITHRVVPNRSYGAGSFFVDHFDEDGAYYLLGSRPPTLTIERENLQSTTKQKRTPLIIDHELQWSDELDFSKI